MAKPIKSRNKTCIKCQNKFQTNRLYTRMCDDCKSIPQNKSTTSDKARTCLKCDSEFPSQGVHNRICPNCRKKQNSRQQFHTRPNSLYRPGGSGQTMGFKG